MHVALADRAERAANRGSLLEAAIAGIGSALAGNAQQIVKDPRAQMMAAQFIQERRARRQAEQAARYAQRQAQNAQPPRLCPFSYLGLDESKATVADVRRVQKGLAQMYHGDKAGPAVNNAKMAEVNAAVESCLAALKRKG